MSIDAVEVTAAQAASILAIEEDHFNDHKDKRIAPSKLTAGISSFANTDGGDLYIGVDQDTRSKATSWSGFEHQEDANAHLQVFEKLFPLGQHYQYEFLKTSTKVGYVLHVQVHKAPAIVRASDGIAYIRRGAQKLPCTTADALRRLELNKGIASFEAEVVSAASIEDVAGSQIIADFIAHVIPSTEPKPWLRKQHLVVDDKPTVAGTVLFCDEPQAVLPKRCSIKIYRYRSRDTVGTRETLAETPLTVEGCAYNQIYAAVRQTKELIEGIKKLGVQGLEAITYPDETLHEIITNAVLHRDYSIADDVHVRIFDNRVEVESPGTLPGHVTVSNILAERYSRNGTIVRLINKFKNPPNKDVGEGLNTAFAAMKSLRLVEPTIEQRESSVIVFIKHEPLASPESIIVEYLEHNDTINNSKARELCHIPEERRMRILMQQLAAKGEIEKVPGTNTASTSYRKPKTTSSKRK